MFTVEPRVVHRGINFRQEMEDLEALKKRAEGGLNAGELSKGETIASGILAKTITFSKQAGQAIKQLKQHKISETVV